MFLAAVCAHLPACWNRPPGFDVNRFGFRTEAQPDTLKITSSATCTPSGRLFTSTSKRDHVFCHVVAESGIRQSFVGRTNFPCCRYIDSGPGGSGDFVQRSQGARSPRRARSKRRRIQRFRLVRWSTLFWGAEEFGFMAPRTEDQEQPIAPPERHVSAKGSHCRQRSRSAAKESVLSALIQKQCRSRPSRRRDWVSREPTSDGVLFQA